jgi:hypothetical protein
MAHMEGGAKLKAKLAQLSAKVAKKGEVDVGFLESATYPNGTYVAQVAFWNEFGTKTAPARPFFRPMISNNEGHWGDNLGKALKHTDYDVAKSLEIMGMTMADELQESIVDVQSPPLSPVTLMLRKMWYENTSLIITGKTVAEARRRVAAGESVAGAPTKPLIFHNIMRSAVSFEVKA